MQSPTVEDEAMRYHTCTFEDCEQPIAPGSMFCCGPHQALIARRSAEIAEKEAREKEERDRKEAARGKPGSIFFAPETTSERIEHRRLLKQKNFC